MAKKIVIVGGVAGGATAAARLRRLDESSTIVMIERGDYISFANCGLPYYIGHVIKDREDLLVQSVDSMKARFHLDIRTGQEVLSIDRAARTLQIKRLPDGSLYTDPYDVLVLATGAEPAKPAFPVPPNLFTLRTIPDTDAIDAFIRTNRPSSALVIGGGFIGLEMTENLVARGIHVTLLQHGEHVMRPLDFEMAQLVHRALLSNGVELILKDEVASCSPDGRSVTLASGRKLSPDLIIYSVGVKPESALAKTAGLALNARGGIVTNDRLQTSDPAIYAVGDSAEIANLATGDRAMFALAGPANREARVAANSIAGLDSRYPGSLGTNVLSLFGLTVASTGLNEKQLRDSKRPYAVLHTHPMSHAGYYPGAAPLAMKLLFNPTDGALYGAQAIGDAGACKRIDVIATAIAGRLRVTDLGNLDLAYAPPYSSAKDPVNMFGFYGENLLAGLDATYQWHEVAGLVSAGAFFLDIREPEEFELGAIRGAVNIPLAQLRARLSELPKDRPLYIYCQSGVRSHTALRILLQHGFKALALDGGYKTYRNATAPLPPPRNTAPATAAPSATPASAAHALVIDACGLQCPGPIVKLRKAAETLKPGDTLEISASDPGFLPDVAAWAAKTGNEVLSTSAAPGGVKAVLRIGKAVPQATVPAANPATTIVVFSGDLDKAIAAFIIATGAAAMGRRVSLFFTFWGLNILRKGNPVAVQKTTIERLFGWMMPRGAKRLALSKLNMLGMGSAMIKSIMRQKHVDSLPALIANAQAMGIKLTACSMTMDLMGIKREELIDGVEIGGVASYLGDASDATHNLFI